MNDLIARLEKADGPDRGLDSHIYLATRGRGGFDPEYKHSIFSSNLPEWCRTGEIGRVADNYEIPHYTASIDTALTLVPEGWAPAIDLYVLSDEPGGNVWRTFVRNYDDARLLVLHATAQTAALSTCIAALKARAAISAHSNQKARET